MSTKTELNSMNRYDGIEEKMKVTRMRVMEVERGFTNYGDGTKVRGHRGIVVL